MYLTRATDCHLGLEPLVRVLLECEAQSLAAFPDVLVGQIPQPGRRPLAARFAIVLVGGAVALVGGNVENIFR